MNVTIKTPFGEMTFDMSTDNAMDLLRRATEYAEFHQPAPAAETVRAATDPLLAEPTTMVLDKGSNPVPAPDMSEYTGWIQIASDSISRSIDESTEKDTDAPKLEPAPETKAPPRSRVETMFGDRATWNKPAAEQKPEPQKHDYSEGYRGFLYVKCDECGEETGYCIKTPSTIHRCNCGSITNLRDLLPMYVKCKCGSEFKYRTNINAHTFTIKCLRCGAPVDMALNKLATAYVTVGSLRR